MFHFKIAALVFLTAIFLSAGLMAQDPPVSAPTIEHQILQNDVGVWDAKIRLFVNGPDTDPVVVTGVETNKMLGDYWLMSELEYDLSGQMMIGRGQFGFDANKKKFIGTWCDSSSPYMNYLEGEWDKSNNTWTYFLSGHDAEGNPIFSKMITKIESQDRKTFEMYLKLPGDESQYLKMMDVEYARRK